MENDDLNVKLPEIPRKKDSNSIQKRHSMIKRMSIEELNKHINKFEQEINELKALDSKLEETKKLSINKSIDINSKEQESELNLKLIRNLFLSIENSKKILLNAYNANLDIVYSNTKLEESFNQDINSIIKNNINKLITNTYSNRKLNTLPNDFDYQFIKDEILQFLDNDIIDIKSSIKRSIEILNNTNVKNIHGIFSSITPLFSSISHFGNVVKQTGFSNDSKFKSYLEFIGTEEHTSWREINSNNRSDLTKAFNSLIKIYEIYKKNQILKEDNNKIILLLTKSSDILEEIIRNQILSLSRKETEIGIKNTILTILVLSSIYEPFVGISDKLKSNIRISEFKNNIIEFKDLIPTLINNIRSVFQQLKIPSYNFSTNHTYLEEVGLLYKFLNFTPDEKEDFLILKKAFDIYKSDEKILKTLILKSNLCKIDYRNFEMINDKDITLLPKVGISNKKLVPISQLFEFLKSNKEYTSILDKKISCLAKIHKLNYEFSSNFGDIKEVLYFEIIDDFINTMNLKELSVENIGLVTCLLKIIDDIQNDIKSKENDYQNLSKDTKENKLTNTVLILQDVLKEVVDRLEIQRERHETISNTSYIDKKSNFENLKALIPTLQKEIQSFISSLNTLISELKELINGTKNNIKQNQPYTAPILKKTVIKSVEKNSNKILNKDEVIDLKKTNIKGLDISQILKDLNIKPEDKS